MSSANAPLFDLSGKVAMVTGGGSGLGREFCNALSEFGADVICPDLRKDLADETCEMIKRYGHRNLPLALDVSKYDQVEPLFREIEATFGRLDILVNNAGVTTFRRLIDEIDIADWHRLLDINLHGTFYCTKEALKIMKKQKRGSIINIASILGLTAVDPAIVPIAPYVVSKFAIVGLTKQGAAEYGPYGIRVNAIAPGWFMEAKLAEHAGITRTPEEVENIQKLLSSKTPMQRTGQLNELRGLIVYLASDASTFVTGQVIAVDGGWTCI